MHPMNLLCCDLEAAKTEIVNNVLFGDYRRKYTPEIDMRPLLNNYSKSVYGGKFTLNLLNIVQEAITLLRPNNYIKKISFNSPVSANIHIKAFNENFACEEDYADLRPEFYTIHVCSDTINSLDYLVESYVKERVRRAVDDALIVKDAELDAQEERLKNFDQVIDLCAGQEREVGRLVEEVEAKDEEISKLREANIDLETKVIAMETANYALEPTTSTVDNLEDDIARKKMMQGSINMLKAQLEKKKTEIKILRNKLSFVRGQKDMIRDVLDGGTLVVHREASTE